MGQTGDASLGRPAMIGIPRIYLDYNATAPLLPAALERMQAALRDFTGNPSSPHAFGQAARDALESARSGIARRLGCSRRELTFTSGGSESNNTVFRAMAEGARPAHVITTPIEHPSVLRCCDWLQAHGVAVPPPAGGRGPRGGACRGPWRDHDRDRRVASGRPMNRS